MFGGLFGGEAVSETGIASEGLVCGGAGVSHFMCVTAQGPYD